MDHYRHLYAFSIAAFARDGLVGDRPDSTRLFAAKGSKEICLLRCNLGNKVVVPSLSSFRDGNLLLDEVEALRSVGCGL